jgi:pyruvate ferredoxin oxidoreductase alpha subunit
VTGLKSARIGIVSFGSTFGAITEGMNQLAKRGVSVRFHQIRTIWPILADDLREFIDSVDTVFVIESNYQGQLASLIKGAVGSEKIQSMTKFDGSSFKPIEITNAILTFNKSGAGV